MVNVLLSVLSTFNQILTAGIVILAFSLLLYALTFNLRDRVARSFALMLAFVCVVYFGDVAASLSDVYALAEPWLRLQWLGIAFVPAAYAHFSDALLATTGQPSRWRRRLAVRVLYAGSGLTFVFAALSDWLVEPGGIEASAPYLSPGPLFPLFGLFFLLTGLFAVGNLLRAHRRCLTATTRRRMGYLIASSIAPAIGAFPYLVLTREPVTLHPLSFWAIVVVSNLVVSVLLTVMAYTVAYFGVTQPDRVVKGRLFQWLLRGPTVAFFVLAAMVLMNRYGRYIGVDGAKAMPIVVIGVLLLLQFTITLVRLPIERWLFYGADRADVRRLQALEERLLSAGDLRQFMESVLAAASDLLRVQSGFIAGLGPDGLELEVTLGADNPFHSDGAVSAEIDRLLPLTLPKNNGAAQDAAGSASGLFVWNGYWVAPLRPRQGEAALGLMGLKMRRGNGLTPEETEALRLLAERAGAALEDRRLQRDVFGALDRMIPQIESIQQMRAAARYGGADALTVEGPASVNPDLSALVKDALSHYWGGPKLTASPLMRLRVVERALREHDGNAANALRAVLRDAIERVKPEGQRKFTAEWILYNILEMKFLQGRRVRDIAMRLAVSEADLYRKQRVAVEQVARIIAEMERAAAAAPPRPAPVKADAARAGVE